MAYAQPAEPASGDKFDLKGHPEWEGALALVFPKEYNEPRVWSDKFKDPTASVTCDIVLLDRIDPQTRLPVQLNNTMVFGKVMVPQLKTGMDNGDTEILARISKVPAKVGDFAWKFTEFTAGVDDVQADAWIRAHPRTSFTQPSGAGAVPAGNSPWDLPAAPPAAAPPAAAPANGAGGWNAGGQVPPAAAPAQAGWGAPVAPTPPAPQQLREFLIANGVDVNAIPDQPTAEAVAMTYGQKGVHWV